MHRSSDFDLAAPLPSTAPELLADLGLAAICSAMADGDRLVLESSRRALLCGLTDPDEISYRQRVLEDSSAHAQVVRHLFQTSLDALAQERRVWGLYSGSPQSVLSRAISATEVLIAHLEELRRTSDEHGGAFSSEAFTRFFKMLSSELDDDYLGLLGSYVEELRFKNGLLLSGHLGEGTTPGSFVLRRPGPKSPRPRSGPFGRNPYSFEVPGKDDAGLAALEDLRAQGLNLVANALAQAAENVRSFFTQLAGELAFYIGCLNLAEKLRAAQAPWCSPAPLPVGKTALRAEGLYDPSLVLRQQTVVVGNDVHADAKTLVMVTGANQGGKSTFLRSVGLAQLMMQAGMFVPAKSFEANVCPRVFTHFKREEDPSLKHGKLDEELARMNVIADEITPGCMLLCNESFASTNEREGSEIAGEITKALTDSGVKVLFVTHMYELARRFYTQGLPEALFLRAERLADGQRTFRLVEAPPLPTSFGKDSYWQVFGLAPEPAQTSVPGND